jgi:S-adenosylmethionine:tRNA ribosyltransferase-isomerase
MRVDLFDFELPPELIAQHPADPRDAARLLHIGRRLEDRTILDLPDLLRPGDLLVVNDTRVLPTRLHGRRGEAGVEVTLVEELDPATWRAFARPARKCRPGDGLRFADGFEATVADRTGGEVTLRFAAEGPELRLLIERHGTMPLPPYIRRPPGPADRIRYQTRFAARDGAVAAPTAGLHFTDRLLAALQDRGIGIATLTLHVGAGTFLPVKVDDTDRHRLHGEMFDLPADSAERVNAARAAGARVVAVGTTVLRTLESVAGEDGRVAAASGTTDLFIIPGYRFRVVDLLLTNFHLPRSTLFMLVCAFAGLERMRAAYAHAVATRYRFYSYGDACLIERAA